MKKEAALIFEGLRSLGLIDGLRHLTATELRVEDGEKAPVIKGYAVRFDKWSEKLFGFFREKVQKGAFTKTLGEADIRGLLNHDPNYVLGRNTSGTLRLAEDDKGLAIELDPPDTQWARDLIVSMKRGDVDQMSFGFETVLDEWNEKFTERILIEAKLLDVSVVTFPAYRQTSAVVRSFVPRIEAASDTFIAALFRGMCGVPMSAADWEILNSSIPNNTPAPPSGPDPLHPEAADIKPDSLHLAAARNGDNSDPLTKQVEAPKPQGQYVSILRRQRRQAELEDSLKEK